MIARNIRYTNTAGDSYLLIESEDHEEIYFMLDPDYSEYGGPVKMEITHANGETEIYERLP